MSWADRCRSSSCPAAANTGPSGRASWAAGARAVSVPGSTWSTGVSTGALLATHAFLATPADDRIVAGLYTGIGRDDIYREDYLGGLLGGPALNRTDPMEHLIARTITPETLERVAAEFDRGRRLFVARPTWTTTRSGSSRSARSPSTGGEEGLDLYRKVLRAAASPPILFPPVEIAGHLFADAAVRENLLLMGLLGGGAEPRARPPATVGRST